MIRLAKIHKNYGNEQFIYPFFVLNDLFYRFLLSICIFVTACNKGLTTNVFNSNFIFTPPLVMRKKTNCFC